MRTPIIAGIVAGLALLVGCTAPASPSAPAPASTSPAVSATPATSSASATTASDDAARTTSCLDIAKSTNDAATAMEAALKDIGSDPKKSLAALQEFSASMKTTIATLKDPQVKAQSEKAAAAVDEVSTALEKLIKNPTADALTKIQEPLAKVNTEFTAIGTICGG